MISPFTQLFSVVLLVASLLLPVSAIWPAPNSYTAGTSALFLNQNILVTYNGRFMQYNPGYIPWNSDSTQIVTGGVSRALSAIFQDNFVPWMLKGRRQLSEFEPSLQKGQKWLKTLQIVQTSKDTTATFKPLAGEVDESYNLTISAGGDAKLTAVSSTGVLRGLESFVQLFYKHSAGPFHYTPYAPVAIQDSPKFAHRGILIDVARSWFEVSDITRTIDGMAMNKLNVLHVHVTDSQSWPLEIPSMPEVARKGAYRPDLTYSPHEIDYIQRYGVNRGVSVYFEIDMPGHIGSVAESHPELIVAYNEQPYWWWCAEPPCGAFKLNDSRVDDFLGKLFDDLLPRVAPYSAYFHTGGDELNANDSMLDEGIRSNESTVLQPLLQKFIDTQHARVRKAGLTPITWEEIPIDWNVTVGKDVVVQAWLGDESVSTLTGKGHKVIDSNYNFYYLDCGRGQWITQDNGAAYDAFYPFGDWCDPFKNWRLIYSHDPVHNLTAEQAKLVLGGEVAVWAETIDPMNLDTIIWPRAGAAAEAWWSGRIDPATGENRTMLEITPRLAEVRERLVARGIRSSPVQMPFCTQANPADCSYPL
ncbi:glycoside hydrolase family 20 protein [Bombardia bombarda]|uniref:Beta-hexosaminidase n=1 Tax=Bombardia bombarda TaxID=252184 RepID=A0AA40BXZ4_9PEZI|nr:glycoside hydrolase family 20 protein [Bombardia bombarda]